MMQSLGDTNLLTKRVGIVVQDGNHLFGVVGGWISYFLSGPLIYYGVVDVDSIKVRIVGI